MAVTVGLDIGIASCGWCVLDAKEKKFVDLGVRIFDRAENPKDGSSLAATRRQARSVRRRLRRTRKRMSNVKELFVQSGMLTHDDLNTLYRVDEETIDHYQLRAEGLDRCLTNKEWARVLTQLCKRRGYKSMRLGDKKDSEEGVVLGAIHENSSIMQEKGYRTAGEMLYCDKKFASHKRNTGDYQNVISRKMLLAEIEYLFKAQREFGNRFASDDIKKQYLEILNWQKGILQGDDLRAMVGKCTFFPKEDRIARACPTFERYRLIDHLNKIRYSDAHGKYELSLEDKQEVLAKAKKRKTAFTYADLRKLCNIADSAFFVGIRYKTRSDEPEAKKKAEKAVKLPWLSSFHEIRSAVVKEAGDQAWQDISDDIDLLDSIADVLTYYKSDESVVAELRKLGLPARAIAALKNVRFSKNANLSKKAINALLPFMMKGHQYSEACKRAGFHHSKKTPSQKFEKLPPIPQEEVRNPVVLRALSEARKVLNAIIVKYGPLEQLNIEMARDVGKPFKERDAITKEQEENRKNNESLREDMVKEYAIANPRPHDFIKYKLWKEQGGRCAYTGEYIDPARLLSGEPGVAEVDHVLPHARSFDDSYFNKVLCTAKANQDKAGRTPFEWIGSSEEKWHLFEERVEGMHLPHQKKRNLLKKDFDQRASEEFKSRNLNDTRYIARFFQSFCSENLKFDTESKAPVVTLNGRTTSFMRKSWMLQKVRANGDKHHALDAAVIAATSRGMVQKISRFYSTTTKRRIQRHNWSRVNVETGEISTSIPEPWEGFLDELSVRLSYYPQKEAKALGFSGDVSALQPLFPSRKARHRISGSAHKETIRRKAEHLVDPKGCAVTTKSVALQDLRIKKPGSIKEDDIDRLARADDELLKGALRRRLAEYENNPKKAFAEPFYKPTKSGKPGPLVRRVQVIQNPASSGVEVCGGLADNGEMVRVDVFEKGGKFFCVPLYVADTVKKELPNKAVIAGKPQADWLEMDSDYTFQFSLFKNDPVRLIKRAKGETIPSVYSDCVQGPFPEIPEGQAYEEIIGYYKGLDIPDGTISIQEPDSFDSRSERASEGYKARKDGLYRSLGIKTGVFALNKLNIDVLGKTVTPIRQEKRHGFEIGRDRKRSKPES